MKAGSHSSQATCPEEIVAQKELIERIYEIVNGLKREQRFVFNMRFIPKSAKVTFSEIGRIIDKSPSSVRCYYRSALHAVQRQLRSAEETEPEPVTTLRGATPGDEVTSPKGEKP
jgi:DNA-directed RNA polymerase sigma subunit (sigma70/sigma32)